MGGERTDARRQVVPPAAKLKATVVAQVVVEKEKSKVKKGGYLAQTASSRAKTPPPVRREEKEVERIIGECQKPSPKTTTAWERKKDKQVVDVTWAQRDFYPPPGPSVLEGRKKVKGKTPPKASDDVQAPEPPSVSEELVSPEPKPRRSSSKSMQRSLTPRERYLRESQWVSPTDRHSPQTAKTTAVRDFETWLQKRGEATAAEYEETRLHLEAERKAQAVIDSHIKQDMVTQRRMDAKVRREVEYVSKYEAVQATRSPSRTRISMTPLSPYTSPPVVDRDMAFSPSRR